MAAERVFLSVNIKNEKSDSISLADAASLAIDYLSRDTDGFVLMIEQAKIDTYAHKNQVEGMIDRVKSLNETVETVMAWIGERTDTAVIVTADHETGGFSVSDSEIYSSSYTEGATTVYYQWQTKEHTDTKVPVYVYGLTLDFAKVSKFQTAGEIKNSDIYRLMKAILKANQ